MRGFMELMWIPHAPTNQISDSCTVLGQRNWKEWAARSILGFATKKTHVKFYWPFASGAESESEPVSTELTTCVLGCFFREIPVRVLLWAIELVTLLKLCSFFFFWEMLYSFFFWDNALFFSWSRSCAWWTVADRPIAVLVFYWAVSIGPRRIIGWGWPAGPPNPNDE